MRQRNITKSKRTTVKVKSKRDDTQNSPMMILQHVPVSVWVLCWMAGIISYSVSISGGYVPECIPFIEGCTSISRAGRYGYSYFIFKALMIPAATLIIIYWIMTISWLKAQGDTSKSASHLILFLGITAGLFLILYTCFLGSEGSVYRLMRRFGTTVFFLFSYMGQTLLAYRCYKMFGLTQLTGWKLGLCALVTIQLVTFALVEQLMADSDWIENAIEWQSASILTFLPVLTWLLWRKSGFRIEVKVSNDSHKT